MTETQAQQATPPPRHWEADVLLRDGRTAHIRPIQPEDAELLVEFYARVSDESKYYRFFSPMPQLSERDVKRFTHVDYATRVAFILTVAGEMIAVGRYDTHRRRARPRSPSSSRTGTRAAGSASCCSSTSPRPAASAGIERFVAEVLPDNQAMIHTFRDAGYQVASGYDEGVMQLEFPHRPHRHRDRA